MTEKYFQYQIILAMADFQRENDLKNINFYLASKTTVLFGTY